MLPELLELLRLAYIAGHNDGGLWHFSDLVEGRGLPTCTFDEEVLGATRSLAAKLDARLEPSRN